MGNIDRLVTRIFTQFNIDVEQENGRIPHRQKEPLRPVRNRASRISSVSEVDLGLSKPLSNPCATVRSGQRNQTSDRACASRCRASVKPAAEGLAEAGTSNLNARPFVKNADGSIFRPCSPCHSR